MMMFCCGSALEVQRARRSAAANENKRPAFARDVRRLTHGARLAPKAQKEEEE
jgi:hypothetical protein